MTAKKENANDQTQGEEVTLNTPALSDAEMLSLLASEVEAGELNEARGVAWIDVYGTVADPRSGEIKQVKISLTSRSGVGPKEALIKLMESVKYARETYNLFPFVPAYPSKAKKDRPEPEPEPEPSPKPESKTAQITDEGARKTEPEYVPVQSAQRSAPAAKPQAGEQFIRCSKIEVIPQPESRATLKFYDNLPNHKFPVCFITNWTTEACLKLLEPAGVKADKLTVANNIPVDLWVYYKLSENTTKSGSHYKDITRLEPV